MHVRYMCAITWIEHPLSRSFMFLGYWYSNLENVHAADIKSQICQLDFQCNLLGINLTRKWLLTMV